MMRKTKPRVWPWCALLLGLVVLNVLALRGWRSPVALTPPTVIYEPAESDGPDGEMVVTAAHPKQTPEAIGPCETPIVSTRDLDELAPQALLAPTAPAVADQVTPVSATVPEAPIPAAPELNAADGDIEVAALPLRNDVITTDNLQTVPRQEVDQNYQIDPNSQQATWPHAIALIAQLEALSQQPTCGAWSRGVLDQLAHLETAPSLGDENVALTLREMDQATQEGQQLAASLQDTQLRSEVTITCHALKRRIEIWKQVNQLVREEPTFLMPVATQNGQGVLRTVDSLLQSEGLAQAWRKFLMLDEVQLLVSSDDVNPAARRRVARRVLKRMHTPDLTAEQHEFLTRPEIVQYADQLRLWAYEPLDYTRLLAMIEASEASSGAASAALAADWQTLRWSPFSQPVALGQLINAYYRNANFRVAVSAEMINRLLPEINATEEPVHDQIMGARVHGRSMTFAQLMVDLVPDKQTWRMKLWARGQVDSRTRAAKGPITFFNSGATHYRARKMLTVDRRGMRLSDAQADAENSSRLLNVATNFDALPLFGSLVRNIAVRQHNEHAHEANEEVEWKVGNRAAQRFDAEVNDRLKQADERFQNCILQPLERLHLDPMPVDLQTTDDRVIARYRVAADYQLAAYTPRPQAPINSLLSVQLHESLANNLVHQLHLEGRKIELRDLVKEVTASFGLPEIKLSDDVPDHVFVEFAAQDSVRVRFDQGRIELTMRFASVSHGRDVWKNFAVRTWYVVRASGRKAILARDEAEETCYIQLMGGGSGPKRLALRGIFAAILSKERTVDLVDKRIVEHPNLTDAHISQCVIRDGWFGLALSAHENPSREARARGEGRGARGEGKTEPQPKATSTRF